MKEGNSIPRSHSIPVLTTLAYLKTWGSMFSLVANPQ